MAIGETIEKIPKAILFLIGIILVFAVGSIDYFTGPEISISIFYLLPIALLAWAANLYAGIFLAVISASTWYAADRLTGHSYSLSLIPYWNAAVRFGFFIIVVIILARLKKAYRDEQLLSRTDPLTGAANVRYFYETAAVEIERSKRYSRPFSVAYMDIDNFKEINDRFGHNAGDEMLATVAKIMRDNLRTVDIVARVGGDEFIVLLPESDKDAAFTVMEKIRKLLDDGMKKSEKPVTLSIGAVTFNTPPDSINEMIKKADNLMYLVKASGKNQIIYNTSEK